MKRYLYIILGIIVLAIIAVVVLMLFKGSVSPSTNGLPAASGSLPQAGTQGGNGTTSGATGGNSTGGNLANTNSAAGANAVQSFQILSDNPVLDYFVDESSTITAIEPTGIVDVIAGGQSSVISSAVINNIISAKFSYDGKKILVSFGDINNPQASVFDVTTKAWTSLPQGLKSPQWSASSYQIAYLNDPGAGVTKLVLMDATAPTKVGTVLFSMNAIDLSLQWISKTQFALSDKPTSQAKGSVLVFNTQTKSITPIIYEGTGVETIWTPSGTSTLGLGFSDGSNGSGYVMRLIDTSGNILHNLTFTTLPSKCAFANQSSTPMTATSTSAAATTTTTSTITISGVGPTTTTVKTATTTAKTITPTSTTYLYCGVPTSADQYSEVQLPDDYNTMNFFTIDNVVKLNTFTGQLDTVWSDATQNIDANDMKFFNNTLYLVNRYNQKLYGLTFVSPQ